MTKYNVIKIDMNSEYQNTMDKDKLLWILTEDIKKEMRRAAHCGLPSLWHISPVYSRWCATRYSRS